MVRLFFIRWGAIVALLLCIGAPVSGAASLADRLLSQQTWQSLQGMLHVQVLGDATRSIHSPYIRLAAGDFALRASGQDFQILTQGRLWSRVPGQTVSDNKPAGQAGAFLAMHRLLFAGTAESAALELVSAEGSTLAVRWNDWPGSETLSVELDSQDRATRITAHAGAAVIDQIVYQVTQGKIHPSAWRQQREGMKAGLKVGDAAAFWVRYILEAVQVDQAVPSEAFELP